MAAAQQVFLIAGIVLVMIRFKDVVLRGGYCLSGWHREAVQTKEEEECLASF